MLSVESPRRSFIGGDFRGGAGGASATASKRDERGLLSGLLQLLQQCQSTSTPTPTAKGKGKGTGAKPVQAPYAPQAGATEQKYGLLEALHSLVTRASRNPKGLLQRLQTVIDMAAQGCIRPKKKKTKANSADAAHEAVRQPRMTVGFKSSSAAAKAKRARARQLMRTGIQVLRRSMLVRWQRAAMAKARSLLV